MALHATAYELGKEELGYMSSNQNYNKTCSGIGESKSMSHSSSNNNKNTSHASCDKSERRFMVGRDRNTSETFNYGSSVSGNRAGAAVFHTNRNRNRNRYICRDNIDVSYDELELELETDSEHESNIPQYENFRLDLQLSKELLLQNYFQSTHKGAGTALYENVCRGCGYGVFGARGSLCHFCECIVNGLESGSERPHENRANLLPPAASASANIYENICEKCARIYSEDTCECSASAGEAIGGEGEGEFSAIRSLPTECAAPVVKVKKTKSFNRRIFHNFIGSLRRARTPVQGSSPVTSSSPSPSASASASDCSAARPRCLEIVHHVDGYDNVFRTQETFDLQRICELKRSQTSCSDQHIYGRLKTLNTDHSIGDCAAAAAAEAQSRTNKRLSQSQSHEHLLDTSRTANPIATRAESESRIHAATAPIGATRVAKRSASATDRGVAKPRRLFFRSHSSHSAKRAPIIDSPLSNANRTPPQQALFLDESVCHWLSALRRETHTYRSDDAIALCSPKSVPPARSTCSLVPFDVDAVVAFNCTSEQVTNLVSESRESVESSESSDEVVTLRRRNCCATVSDVDVNVAGAGAGAGAPASAPPVADRMVSEFKRNLMAKQMQQQQQQQQQRQLKLSLALPLAATALQQRAKRQAIYLKVREADVPEAEVETEKATATPREIERTANCGTAAGSRGGSGVVTPSIARLPHSYAANKRCGIYERDSEFVSDILCAFESFLKRETADEDQLQQQPPETTISQIVQLQASQRAQRAATTESIGADRTGPIEVVGTALAAATVPLISRLPTHPGQISKQTDPGGGRISFSAVAAAAAAAAAATATGNSCKWLSAGDADHFTLFVARLINEQALSLALNKVVICLDKRLSVFLGAIEQRRATHATSHWLRKFQRFCSFCEQTRTRVAAPIASSAHKFATTRETNRNRQARARARAREEPQTEIPPSKLTLRVADESQAPTTTPTPTPTAAAAAVIANGSAPSTGGAVEKRASLKIIVQLVEQRDCIKSSNCTTNSGNNNNNDNNTPVNNALSTSGRDSKLAAIERLAAVPSESQAETTTPTTATASVNEFSSMASERVAGEQKLQTPSSAKYEKLSHPSTLLVPSAPSAPAVPPAPPAPPVPQRDSGQPVQVPAPATPRRPRPTGMSAAVAAVVAAKMHSTPLAQYAGDSARAGMSDGQVLIQVRGQAESADDGIYQPIWKFKTLGEALDGDCSEMSIGSESAGSVLTSTEDHGEWETDDEFMFATQLDGIRSTSTSASASVSASDACSLNSAATTRSMRSHGSGSGSTVTGFDSTASVGSVGASLRHHVLHNIGIFFSLTNPRLRAIVYDYDRIHASAYFAKQSHPAHLPMPNDYTGAAAVAVAANPNPNPNTHDNVNDIDGHQWAKWRGRWGGQTAADDSGIGRSPPSPPPRSTSMAKPNLNPNPNPNPNPKGAACGESATLKVTTKMQLLPDSVQAWKFMLLDVNYLEDEEDMIVSETEILRAQEIKEDIDTRQTQQLNILQRFKSASIGNLLIDLPNEDDKKSIAERMRNKLQRGVFKLNMRSPKSEKKSRGIFRRAEATSLYLEDGMKPKYPIFGAPLEQLELNVSTQPNVPRFVVDCIEYIERKDCITHDGLYRASGNKVSIDELKQKLSESYIYDPKLLITDDIHTLTSLLKLFFRELGAPLIPQETYERLGPTLNDAAGIETMRSVFATMREPNYSTLKFLIKHLTNVAAYKSQNRMPASNLAIVWGPCILSANQIEFDIGRMNTLAKVLIEHYDRIFGENERLVS